MELKTCTKCNTEQDIENFYIRRARNQRKTICKSCESKQKARPVEIVPDLEGEIWADIEDFEGVYLVSNLARVKRIMHRKNPTNTLMDSSLNGGGYRRHTLCLNGKRHEKLLSRLVAIAFIPNPENKPEVNHLRGKEDNRACSLEWATTKENIDHAWETGLAKPKLGTLNGNAVLTEDQVLEIRSSTLTPTELSKLYEVNLPAIYKILSRQRWKHI